MRFERFPFFALLSAAFLLMPPSAAAQSLAPADGLFSRATTFVDGPLASRVGGELVLTQSQDFDVSSGGIRCGSEVGGFTTENGFYRVFDLAAYPEITDGFSVTEVGVGIAISSNGWPESTPTQVGLIQLHTLASPPTEGGFEIDDLELASLSEFEIDGPEGARYLQTVPINGSFSNADLLVVEMRLPTGDPDENADLSEPFSVSQGGNDAGVTATEYLAAESCGIDNPTDISMLGTNPDGTPFSSEWVVTVTGLTGAVAGEADAVTRRVTLGPAFPNPTARRTTLPFSLERAQHVRITVYDALGREVAVATDRPFEAGEHAVAVSVAGLPGGLYFYRLRSGEQTLMRRLVVLP